MADLDYDDSFIEKYTHSEDWERELNSRLDFAEDYWREHARKRTGFMSEATETYVLDGEGYFEATASYAGYQEFGTRYIEGMHLLTDIVRALESGQ
jgi:hypothetical protein